MRPRRGVRDYASRHFGYIEPDARGRGLAECDDSKMYVCMLRAPLAIVLIRSNLLVASYIRSGRGSKWMTLKGQLGLSGQPSLREKWEALLDRMGTLSPFELLEEPHSPCEVVTTVLREREVAVLSLRRNRLAFFRGPALRPCDRSVYGIIQGRSVALYALSGFR